MSKDPVTLAGMKWILGHLRDHKRNIYVESDLTSKARERSKALARQIPPALQHLKLRGLVKVDETGRIQYKTAERSETELDMNMFISRHNDYASYYGVTKSAQKRAQTSRKVLSKKKNDVPKGKTTVKSSKKKKK